MDMKEHPIINEMVGFNAPDHVSARKIDVGVYIRPECIESAETWVDGYDNKFTTIRTTSGKEYTVLGDAYYLFGGSR